MPLHNVYTSFLPTVHVHIVLSASSPCTKQYTTFLWQSHGTLSTDFFFSLFRIFFVFPFSSIDLISTNFALRHVIYLLLSLLQHWGCAVQPHQLLNQVPNPGRSDRSPRRQVPVSEPAGAAGCGRSDSTSPRQAGFCSSPTSSAWCPRPPLLP